MLQATKHSPPLFLYPPYKIIQVHFLKIGLLVDASQHAAVILSEAGIAILNTRLRNEMSGKNDMNSRSSSRTYAKMSTTPEKKQLPRKRM